MCVYDLTSERSFESLENYWLKEIRTHAPSNAVRFFNPNFVLHFVALELLSIE